MHILIIPSWYKTPNEPLLGTFFEEQARALMKDGHKVIMIYPCLQTTSMLFKKKENVPFFLNDNGLPTYTFNVQSIIPFARKFNYYLQSLITARVLNKYIKANGKPEIIHAHSVFLAGIVAHDLSKWYKIPYVITEHLTHYMTGTINNKIELQNAVNVLGDASRAISVSSSFKNELVKFTGLNPNKFEVISNLVNDLFFENFKVRYFNQGDEFEFFTNSFLNPRKNHKLIFDAIKILLQRNCKVKLSVGGYGDIENELRNYCKEIGIESVVTFTGALKREEVKQKLDSCHAFLLASKLETFGVVLVEALACGRPIITTDCGGPHDIIADFNGIMVPTFETEDYANAMEKIITDYSNFDQQRITDDCRNRFSEKSILSQLNKMYKEVLKSRQ